MDANVKVRQMSLDDVPFVFSSWLRSYADSDFAKAHRKQIYFQLHHAVIERCMARPSTTVLVACSPSDETQILGFLVAERLPGAPVAQLPEHRTVVHFGYTKSPLRRQGVMAALMKSAELDPNNSFFSHKTWATDTLQKKWPGAVHCLYLV